MARIRTIKPEIWSDPDFVECSPNARLLFLAALNFASDYGVMKDSAVGLKLQCFPGDALDVRPLIDELVAAGLWVRRTAPDGASVLLIRTFTAHQKVDKPQPGRWGKPSDWPAIVDRSPNIPRTIPESSATEGNGMEGKKTPAAKPKKVASIEDASAQRTRREIWSVLTTEFGEPATSPERANRGRQCRDLAAAGASSGDVSDRISEHRNRRLPWTLTANALVTHWTELAPKAVPVQALHGTRMSKEAMLRQ